MHIKELILKTNSLHRTRLFYHKTLELDIVNETDESVSFKEGKTTLTFEEVEDQKPFYHFAFNIVKEGHNIPHFRKGPVLHDFVAMGDDYGLLLVCKTKRGWVPTNKLAQIFPVTIVSEEGDRIVL